MEWFLVGFLVSFISAGFSSPSKTTTMEVNPVIERTVETPAQPDQDMQVASPVASARQVPQN